MPLNLAEKKNTPANTKPKFMIDAYIYNIRLTFFIVNLKSIAPFKLERLEVYYTQCVNIQD
jgi:hypothetical protein